MTESPETHASLILRLHDRADQQAWREFVEIYQPVIYRLARYKGLQHADAEDVVQQVLSAVAGAVGRWEPDKNRGRFRTWLQTERKQSAADGPRAEAPAAAGATRPGARSPTARGKQTGIGDDAIAAQIDRANESARRLESDVSGPPTIDDVIESELDRVDRGLRSLEADVLESLGEG